jgi:hypothetical protein
MRAHLTLLGTLALAIGAAPALGAQTVTGVLVVRDANAPAPNARVSLVTTRGVVVDTARSTSEGRFTVRAPRPGRYILEVRRLGHFAEESDPIPLGNGEVRSDTVYLLSAQALQPVDVVVRKEVQRIFGVDTRFLSNSQVVTSAEMDRFRYTASRLEDVVRWSGIPGVTVSHSARFGNCFTIRMRGCAAVYVDGMLWGTDAWLPADEIESVVVLKGSDSFVQYGTRNGAILVITRRFAAS